MNKRERFAPESFAKYALQADPEAYERFHQRGYFLVVHVVPGPVDRPQDGYATVKVLSKLVTTTPAATAAKARAKTAKAKAAEEAPEVVEENEVDA